MQPALRSRSGENWQQYSSKESGFLKGVVELKIKAQTNKETTHRRAVRSQEENDITTLLRGRNKKIKRRFITARTDRPS